MNTVTTTTKPVRRDRNVYMRNYYRTPNGQKAVLRAHITYAQRKLAALEAK